jgi:8-oxo-dGTP diphosphatase
VSSGGTVKAAGGVVWRDASDGREILLVHRPRYDDWSLPKGKLDPGEHALVAARREIEEETGRRVTLGPPLGIQRYDVFKNGSMSPKLVHYWAARVHGEDPDFTPNDEVDRLEWLPTAQARRRLSYPRDVTVLDALDRVVPVTATLVLLRHAEAIKRKAWSHKDTSRPLSDHGEFTAERLVDVLAALGVDRVLSSDAERCRATVTPYATAAGRPVEPHPEISEKGFHKDPSTLNGFSDHAWLDGRVTVVCSHRPVLPALARELGLKAGKYAPGAFVVAHRLASGRIIQERFGTP